MKRCPQCNRVETDDALAFCRADGTALVSDSSSLNSEAGTVQLDSGSASSEIETSILAHATDANFNRATAPTTVLPAQPPITTAELAKPKRRRTVIAIVIIVTAIVATTSAIVVDSYLSKKNHPAIQSIAVMPFVNESGNADVEYLSDGMTETLISSLSQLPNLNVKARSTVFRYKGKATDAKTIGKELNVQAILNGRIVQRGDQLTLSLELVDAQTENVIWSDKYDRKQTDLVSLQREIARDVASKLKLKLSGADQQKLAKTYTTDPEAYRLYLQGRFYWNKRAGKEFDKAEGYFQQSIAKDPNFALGYVGIADIIQDVDPPKAREYIRRALEIDDQLAEAHASQGYMYLLDYNWAESERALKRAMELNPNYPQAHQWNGTRFMMLGKYDEALASYKRALELDPTSAAINFVYGACLFASGRTDESIQQMKKIIEMDPTFPWSHSFLAHIYRQTGDHSAAVEERAKAFELEGRQEDAKLIRNSFAGGGWNGYLRQLVSTNLNTGSSVLRKASLLAELGDKEKAIATLIDGAARGDFWLFTIKSDPFMDPLRDDPRFQALLKKFDPPQ